MTDYDRAVVFSLHLLVFGAVVIFGALILETIGVTLPRFLLWVGAMALVAIRALLERGRNTR